MIFRMIVCGCPEYHEAPNDDYKAAIEAIHGGTWIARSGKASKEEADAAVKLARLKRRKHAAAKRTKRKS